MKRRHEEEATAIGNRPAAVVLTIALAVGALVLQGRAAAADDAFPPERLDQLVAPIALYPDPLLMNMLMAATYPLEVVQADRWAQGHKDLRGEALDQALAAETWDDSVKALAKLPDVVARMSQNLDWTTDLGEAFLAQQADVLDAVQRMRKHAADQGNLKTSKEQQVVVEKEVITIVPADPQVIYVPTYSAPAVYGPSWNYPTNYYPAMYTYPPGYVATTSLLSFGVGVAVGAAVWGSADWGGHHSYCCGGWGHGHNDIDIDRNVNINNVNVNKKEWNHNPEHRRGASYKNDQVRDRYRDADAGRRDLSREQARGHAREGGVDRAAADARQREGGKRDVGKAGAPDRPRAQEQARGGERAASAKKPEPRKPERAAAASGDRGGKTSGFGGGSGKSERAASARGSQSRNESRGGDKGGAKRSGGGGGGSHGGGGSKGGGGGKGGGGHGGGGRRK